MSLLHRVHEQAASLSPGSVEEHQAVVELLALAAYVDNTVTDAEFEELAAFDASHAFWDDEAFSVLQHLPVAIAHARAGSTSIDQLAQLVTTPAVRRDAVKAVSSLLSADGVTADEGAFLQQVRRAFD